MSVANENGTLTNVNNALLKQLSYTIEEMKNKPIVDFIHPDDHHIILSELEKKNRHYKTRVLKGIGKYCIVSVNAREFTAQFGHTFSVAHIKCVEPNCPDLK